MSTEIDDEGCGTYGGAQAHARRGEETCDDCKAARNEYTRTYRAAKPDAVRSAREKQSAREKALRKLATQHPEEFRNLLERELQTRKAAS